MKLLLISNSTNVGEAFLEYPKEQIREFLSGRDEAIFIPYAAVTFSYDQYLEKVQKRFDEFGIKVRSIHHEDNPIKTITNAQTIVIGGGNTFQLLKKIQEEGIIEAIRDRIFEGIPYIGWSAGSNVACPTICTTNDMPIVQPESLKAIGLIKFQINPHYTDFQPEGHAGETREQRIEEFITVNPDIYVAGLREGCMLKIDGNHIELIGPHSMRIFRSGEKACEFSPGDDLGFLL